MSDDEEEDEEMHALNEAYAEEQQRRRDEMDQFLGRPVSRLTTPFFPPSSALLNPFEGSPIPYISTGETPPPPPPPFVRQQRNRNLFPKSADAWPDSIPLGAAPGPNQIRSIAGSSLTPAGLWIRTAHPYSSQKLVRPPAGSLVGFRPPPRNPLVAPPPPPPFVAPPSGGYMQSVLQDPMRSGTGVVYYPPIGRYTGNIISSSTAGIIPSESRFVPMHSAGKRERKEKKRNEEGEEEEGDV